jgi:DNA-binding CsgD family transcriptional regulator
LLFQWQSAWVVLDFKSIVLSSVIAWVLCELFFVVVMMFIGVVALICTTLLPLLSYLLLLKSKQLSKPVPPFGQLGVDVGLRVLARLALMGFLFGLINEYMRLSYVQRDFSLAGSAFLTGVYALTLPLVLLVAGITVVWPLLRAKPIQFETPYRVVYMLSAAGVLLLLLPENPPFISYALNMTAFLCLGFIFWAAVIGLCRKHPRSSVRIFGFTQAAWISGPLIIAQTNHELFIRDLLPSAEVVVIAGVFILLMTYCFVFRETDIAATTAEGRSAGFMEKCAQLSWRYHLTNREQEVLVCLAKGRDIAWIQKQLCLSKSTVSTHRQHIYEKIGIHTRQELIDHIEAIE